LNEKRDKLLIQGCEQRKDVCAFFSSGILKNLSAKILLLKIQFDDGNAELSMDEQKTLSKIFSERDAVFVINTKNSQKSAIYWTSKKIGYLLAVNAVSKMSLNKTGKLLEFIENFLIESLEKCHIGKNIYCLLLIYIIGNDHDQIMTIRRI